MQTLYDFGIEVQKIREAADSLTVTGSKNASLVVYIFNKCNDIIQSINEVIEQHQNPPADQNGEGDREIDEDFAEEEGEMNGEPDSATVT